LQLETICEEELRMREGDKAWIDVKELRKKRGWLQREAEEQLGVTRAYLSSVEHGSRGISLSMMAAIIRVFGVRYEDFYAQRLNEEKNKDHGGKK
jgi:transcriptional regulator with XRE-family HTH domain